MLLSVSFGEAFPVCREHAGHRRPPCLRRSADDQRHRPYPSRRRFFHSGRKDNIINSGGIKIQPEEVEKKLRPFIRAPFAVTSVPDKRLGEALVLLVEDSGGRLEACPDWLAQLPPYHRPKRIRYVKELPGAGNGKVDRAGCRRLAHALFASNGADEAQRAE